jgi:amidophosphoribosyltransferase
MCGVFGVFNVPDAAKVTFTGLHHLQHRGTDAAGIVSSDGENLYRERAYGKVSEGITDGMLSRLHGRSALGHNRYGTSGEADKTRDNIQPMLGGYAKRQVAVAHNGNFTNEGELRNLLELSQFSTTMDTECALRLLQVVDTGDIEADLITVFSHLRGSATMAFLLPGLLIGVQDPSDCHPLIVASIGEGYCLTSEACTLPSVGGRELFKVEPGQMVIISGQGPRVVAFAVPARKRCMFENVYFSHPASDFHGEGEETIDEYRVRAGRALERQAPVIGADVVIAVPDSSLSYAVGYAESGRSGIYAPGIYRHHNAGRTFTLGTQDERDAAVLLKFTFSRKAIEKKRIVLIDDSIVRGTTLKNMARILFELGALEVHLRIGSPPVAHPCTYGISTRTYSELLNTKVPVNEMAGHLGVTSLEFLSLDTLKELSGKPEDFCFACMDGKYW